MKYLERFLWCALVVVLLVMGSEFVRTDSWLTEFSPDTLQLRTTAIGFIRGRPLVRESQLANYLVEKGYVQPLETESPRWLFVGHYSQAWRDGQGRLAYVFTWSQDEWIEWCEEDPERARLLWDTVFPLLRSNDKRKIRAGETIAWACKRSESIEDLKFRIDSALVESGFPPRFGTVDLPP